MQNTQTKTELRIVPDLFSEKVLILEGGHILGDLTPVDARHFAGLLTKAAGLIEKQQDSDKKKSTDKA